MSRSLHTQQLTARAARRLARPRAKRRADAALLAGRAASDAGDEPEVRRILRVQKPLPGCIHPIQAHDIHALIAALGPPAIYGIRSILLRRDCGFTADTSGPRPRGPREYRIVFGEYLTAGEVRLYSVPLPPWQLRFIPDHETLATFMSYGACIEIDERVGRSTVDWRGTGLRDFYLYDVLAHELGHHRLQYHRGKRREIVCRRKDHELRAELLALQAQTRLYRPRGSS